MKRTLMCLLAVGMLLSGCVSKKYEGKRELTFWHAMADPKDKVLNILIKNFEKENPQIRIKPQYVGNYDVLLQKLLASAAAGNSPDMAQVYENWTTRFKEEGLIVPISDLLDKDPKWQEDKKDIYPVFIKNSSYDNKMWTFPFNKSIYVYYYNEKLFKDAELVPPGNLVEFLSVCSKLTKRDATGKTVQYGFGFRANIDIFAILLYMNNGSFFDEKEVRSTFNNAAGVETLQFISDLYSKYKVATYSKDYIDGDFTSGRLASFFSTSPHRSYLEPQCKFPLGVAPLPSGKIETAPIAGTNIAIFTKKGNEQGRIDACYSFIKWISNTENNVKWAIGTSYLPIRRSALLSSEMKEHLQRKPMDMVGIQELEKASTDPRIKQWQEVRIYIGDALEKVLLKKATPKEALDEAASKVDSLLKK